MKTAKSTALLLLLACAAGCSRCGGGKSASSAEELLAPKAALSATTGVLGAFGQHLASLVERAAAIPGGEQLSDLRRQLAGQLGFDPLTRDGQLAAGLDPDRAAAFVATLPDGPQGRPSWVVALPLTRPDQFLATADKLLRERGGLPLRTEEPRGDAKVVVFARAGAAGAAAAGHKVAISIVRGYGLIARGSDPAAEIGAALARTREGSLAVSGQWSAAKSLLKPDGAPAGDVLVFAPAGSELGSRLAGRPLAGDSSLALSFGATGLQARIRAGLSAEAQVALGSLLPGGGADLLPLLPQTAPIRARLGLSPAQVGPQLERVPFLAPAIALLRQQAEAKGVQLDRDLFGALRPGLVVSIATAPTLDLAGVINGDFLEWRGGRLEWKGRSPFDFVQVAALAEVANRDRLLLALDAVATLMPRLSAQAARTGDDWQITFAAGAGARFGVRTIAGRTLAYLVSGGLTPESLAPAPGAADPALAGPTGIAASIDLGKLAAALHALPESTYGSGPSSFIARSLVGQVIEPLKSLRGSVQLAPGAGGVAATVTLEIVALPSAPAPTPRP